MPLKDLSGKTVYDLDQEDFEKLFCNNCLGGDVCPKDKEKVFRCQRLLDTELWDKLYRKN